MAEIMPKILNNTFRIHTQRRLFNLMRQRIFNNKRLGINDDSPMIRNLYLFSGADYTYPRHTPPPSSKFRL
jgi:hypothetical protein